MTALKFCRLP